MTLESLPLTPNGKINRKALPAPNEEISREHEYIAPRNPSEETLAKIFANLLNVKNVGVNDNFFELGGHSILAVRLMSRIQQQFEVSLPLATLFQNPTVEQLVGLLDSSTVGLNSILVPIKTNGDKSPLFCIHPVGGNVLCYADLANHLDQNYSIYGLQSQGLDGLKIPLSSIEEMASEYIKEIEKVQPQEPYHLIGWSMGGLIAFEIARQLETKNKSVALLTLIDSYAPNAISLPSAIDEVTIINQLAQDWSGIYGRKLDISIETLRKLELGDRIKYLFEQAKKQDLFPAEMEMEQMVSIWKVFKANMMAIYHYQPKIYSGSMILLNASQRSSEIINEPTYGWNSFVQGKVQASTITGDHYTIVKAPQVKHLAAELNNYLQLFSGQEQGDLK